MTPTTDPTTQSLHHLVEDAGLSADAIQKALGIKAASLKQYLKPSVTPPEQFAADLSGLIATLSDAARKRVIAANSIASDTVDLAIYHARLPSFPIEQLQHVPRLHRGDYATPYAGEHDFETTVSASDWIDRFIERTNGFYNEQPNAISSVTVLIGEPGSGKTTLVKKLARALAGNQLTPLLIPLSIYNTRRCSSLLDAACQYYEDYLRLDLPVNAHFLFKREFREHRLVLLADSIDEADAQQRRRILHQCQALRMDGEQTPLLLTSRFVEPRLDQRFREQTEQRWFIGRLDRKQMLDHIALVRRHHEEEAGSTQRIAQSASRNLDRLSDYVEELWKEGVDQDADVTQSERQRVARNEGRLDQLEILTRPIYLNLYIAQCLERGVRSVSTRALVASYLDFLMNEWAASRSLAQFVTPTDWIRLQRALAYAAYELAVTEYTGGARLTERVLRERIALFFQSLDRASSSDEEIQASADDLIESALTAELFEQHASQDGNKLIAFKSPLTAVGTRFALVQEHYLAEWIAFATTNADVLPRRSELESAGARVPSAQRVATYDNFLRNPTLRFLEPAVRAYVESLLTTSVIHPRRVEDLLHNALETPCIDPDLVRCSAEDIAAIAPLNLVFLGRLASRSIVRVELRDFSRALGEVITSLYLSTNFEYVFQALFPFAHSQPDAGSLTGPSGLSSSEFVAIDRAWRNAANCQELVKLGERAGDRAHVQDEKQRDILLRRIVYQFRHHPASFDQLALEWLMAQATGGVSAGVFSTLRSLSSDLDRSCHIGARVDELVSTQDARVLGTRRDFQKRVDWARRNSADERDFVRALCGDAQIKFDVPTHEDILQDLVDHPTFRGSSAVLELSELLSDPGSSAEARVNALVLLRLIASTPGGQRLFLPPEVAGDVFGSERLDIGYDRRDLLTMLFVGAKSGLIARSAEPNGAVSQFEDAIYAESNEAAPVGARALQEYDYFAELIWRVLNYDPQADYHDYE
ncbi:MAG: NACHT domain-containing protein [Acidimicrobiia bacterium]